MPVPLHQHSGYLYNQTALQFRLINRTDHSLYTIMAFSRAPEDLSYVTSNLSTAQQLIVCQWDTNAHTAANGPVLVDKKQESVDWSMGSCSTWSTLRLSTSRNSLGTRLANEIAPSTCLHCFESFLRSYPQTWRVTNMQDSAGITV